MDKGKGSLQLVDEEESVDINIGENDRTIRYGNDSSQYPTSDNDNGAEQ